MFLLLAAQPFKMVFNTISGTMANAGSSQPMMYPAMPPAPRPKTSSAPIQVAQPLPEPKRQNLQMQQPGSFVKFEDQNLYLGPDPIFMTCPSCLDMMTTKVIYEKGENPPPCSALLCCSDSLKDALHYCPKCHAYLGKFVP